MKERIVKTILFVGMAMGSGACDISNQPVQPAPIEQPAYGAGAPPTITDIPAYPLQSCYDGFINFKKGIPTSDPQPFSYCLTPMPDRYGVYPPISPSCRFMSFKPRYTTRKWHRPLLRIRPEYLYYCTYDASCASGKYR